MRVQVTRRRRVIAEDHWDARGTLGVDREAPVGLTDIALTLELDTDAAMVQRLVEISERFRVVYQTLRTPPGSRLRTGSWPGPNTRSRGPRSARRHREARAFFLP
jgi:hypothetical protein